MATRDAVSTAAEMVTTAQRLQRLHEQGGKPSSASFAPSGELLIDGLGIDGRDCTQDEPGWAEPGSMSLLWGQKPGSPTSKPRGKTASLTLSAVLSTRDQSQATPSLGLTTYPKVSPPAASAQGYKPHMSLSQSLTLQLGSRCNNCPMSSPMIDSASHRSQQSEQLECKHCLSFLIGRRQPSPFVPATIVRDLRGEIRWPGPTSPDLEKAPLEREGNAEHLDGIVEEGVEDGTSIGGKIITIVDIIQGRTCRPISLMDLRAFLASQRSEENRSGFYQPASALTKEQACLPDFSMLGGTMISSPQPLDKLDRAHNSRMSVHDSERTPVGLVASSAPTDTASREQLHPSQPDADRCLRAAPDVSADHGDELDAVNFLASFYSWQKRYFSSLASAKSGSLHRREVCPTTTIRHGPESPHFVPLRREMLRILDTYLGPAESEAPKQSHRNEPDRHHASPRLAWMLDLGLIPESTIRAARVAALISMQPDAFGETVQAVVSYLNCHVVPAFFFSKAKNLSKHTERGRLGVGITCTVVAILFSVLLALKPSPLYVGPHSSGTVSRWYRLLLAPLWCAGIGYSMAAWTGICVWLSLRGKREPAEPEIIHRGAEILSVLESGDEDALSERILAEEQDRSARQRWMAPELESLLTRMHLWRARPASQALSSTSRADAFSAASLPTSQPSQLLQFAASGAESLGSTAARQKTEDLSSAASPPTSPIMAPSPPALLLASPSLKSRRIPVLPFEVALIGKPTFFADLGAGAATTALPPSQQAQTHNTPTTSVMSMAGTNPGWMRVAVDVSAMRSAWTRVKQATGFAVHTEPVLDENLRREQQKAALRALCICFLLTVVVLVMTVAVP